MFENIGTALVQAFGFLGVFSFFIYQLIKDTKINNSPSNTKNIKNKDTVKEKKINRSFFRRNKVEEVNEKPVKKGWFNR